MTMEQSKYAIRAATEQRLMTKATLTLLGICTGLVADGKLSDEEIRFLSNWMLDNREVIDHWPGNVIAKRLEQVMADGVITAVERDHLLETLKQLTGTDFVATGSASPDSPVAAELVGVTFDNVPLQFIGNVFCCTGRFIHGTRNACHQAIEELGGVVSDNMNARVDYLVIGALTQPDWAYQTYGRKIEKAAELRARDGRPQIISESAWTACILAQRRRK